MCKSSFPVFFFYGRRMQQKKPLPLFSRWRWPQRFCLLFFFLLFATFSFSSDPAVSHTLKRQQATGAIDWKLDATVNGVEFYHAIVECGGRNIVFLKVNNKNNYRVNVTWKEVFTTPGGQEIVGAQEQKKLLLSTGEIFENNCENMSRKELVIFPEQVHASYVVKIAKFNYKDIAVSRAG